MQNWRELLGILIFWGGRFNSKPHTRRTAARLRELGRRTHRHPGEQPEHITTATMSAESKFSGILNRAAQMNQLILHEHRLCSIDLFLNALETVCLIIACEWDSTWCNPHMPPSAANPCLADSATRYVQICKLEKTPVELVRSAVQQPNAWQVHQKMSVQTFPGTQPNAAAGPSDRLTSLRS